MQNIWWTAAIFIFIAYLFLKSKSPPFGPPIENMSEQDIPSLLREKRKIDAIKVMRKVKGLGLKESKDLVDNLEKELRERGELP